MLGALGAIYGRIAKIRNGLYLSDRLKRHRLPAPTISVGNLTVGGTGKTPIVAYLAEYLSHSGEKVCIISRGYKREDENKLVLVSDNKQVLSTPREAGDEPIELAQRLLGKAVVVSDSDRVRAANWAHENLDVSDLRLCL